MPINAQRPTQKDALTPQRLATALLSGGVLSICFPPLGLFFLMPLALAGLLAAIETLTPRLAFYTGLTFGIGFFPLSLFWFWNLFGTGSIGLWVLCALFPALFGALYAGTAKRMPLRWTPLLAAALWTSVEFVRSEWMVPAFPFLGLGYAFVKASGFVSLASVLGTYGVTFVVMAFSAALAPRLLADLKAGSLRPALFAAGWMALLFVPRPLSAPPRPFQIRLVQAPSEDDTQLRSLTLASDLPKPDVIVWPEYSFLSDPRPDPRTWNFVTSIARERRAYLLFGAKDEGGLPSSAPARARKAVLKPSPEARTDLFKNTAFLLDPQGNVAALHVKNHTVPLVQDGKAGTAVTVAETPVGRLGLALCYDLDFPDVARRTVNAGAEILLAPSNNPEEWGSVQKVEHAQMFAMRAIECERWVAVADVAGSTALYAPNGRSVLPFRRDDPFGITTQAGLETHRTIYVTGGWFFPYVCLAGSLLLGFGAFWKKPNAPLPTGDSAR